MKKVLLAAAALIFASCAAGNVENAPLENTQWKLTELSGETNPAFESGDSFTLTLDGESVHGKGSVNRFFGGYTLSGDNGLAFGDNMGMTRMMGENIDLEDAYVRMLSTVDGYTIDGDVLTLMSDGESVAKFVMANNDVTIEDDNHVPAGLPVISIEEVEAMQTAE